MFTLDGVFTDIHGVQFNKPVILINHMIMDGTIKKTYIANQDDCLSEESAKTVFSQCIVQFNAFMFPDENTMNKKFKPMNFKDSNGNEWFSVYVSSDKINADIPELIALCEEEIKNIMYSQGMVKNEQ